MACRDQREAAAAAMLLSQSRSTQCCCSSFGVSWLNDGAVLGVVLRESIDVLPRVTNPPNLVRPVLKRSTMPNSPVPVKRQPPW